jgi:hypothetical protein
MTTTTKLAIKATTTSGYAPIHGDVQYSLPTQGEDGEWTPGAWHRVGAGEVAYRAHGVHVCQPSQYGYWAQLLRRVRPGLRCRVWVVEYRGQVSIGANGFAAREVRLVRPYVRGEVL